MIRTNVLCTFEMLLEARIATLFRSAWTIKARSFGTIALVLEITVKQTKYYQE
jgi:hypothetical protein